MLTLVYNVAAQGADRLRVATAHLQSAIVHLNNAAQSRISPCASDARRVEELRLIVVALAEIIDALHTMDVSLDDECGAESSFHHTRH